METLEEAALASHTLACQPVAAGAASAAAGFAGAAVRVLAAAATSDLSRRATTTHSSASSPGWLASRPFGLADLRQVGSQVVPARTKLSGAGMRFAACERLDCAGTLSATHPTTAASWPPAALQSHRTN